MIPRGIHFLEKEFGTSMWFSVHAVQNQTTLGSKKSRSKINDKTITDYSNSNTKPSLWSYITRAYERYTQASHMMTVMKHIRGTPNPLGAVMLFLYMNQLASESPEKISANREEMGLAMNTPGYISGMTTF